MFALGAFLVTGQKRVELKFAVRIAVAPEPLLAGGFHCHVRLRHIELKEQQTERRHRDGDQNKHRDDRLCVVREETGLLRELNFTTTVRSNANTKIAMAEITHNRKSWNQMMSSITGVAPFCRPSCHGSGWPDAASATSAVMRGTLVPMNVINRLSTSLFDALLRRKKRPCSARHYHGRGSLGGAAVRGEIPASQTTIPVLPQCAL